jgi:hypothetical protein
MVVFNKKLLLSLFISLFWCGFGTMKRAVATETMALRRAAEREYRKIFLRVAGILKEYFETDKKAAEDSDFFEGLKKNLEKQKEKLKSIDSKNNLNVDSSSSSSSSSSVGTSAGSNFNIFVESQSLRVHVLMNVAETSLERNVFNSYYNDHYSNGNYNFFNSETLANVLNLTEDVDNMNMEELAKDLNNMFSGLFFSIIERYGKGPYSSDMTTFNSIWIFTAYLCKVGDPHNSNNNFALFGLMEQIIMLSNINRAIISRKKEEEEEEDIADVIIEEEIMDDEVEKGGAILLGAAGVGVIEQSFKGGANGGGAGGGGTGRGSHGDGTGGTTAVVGVGTAAANRHRRMERAMKTFSMVAGGAVVTYLVSDLVSQGIRYYLSHSEKSEREKDQADSRKNQLADVEMRRNRIYPNIGGYSENIKVDGAAWKKIESLKEIVLSKYRCDDPEERQSYFCSESRK